MKKALVTCVTRAELSITKKAEQLNIRQLLCG